MFRKLAAFGAPVLAICAVLALPVLGSTTAYAIAETPPPTVSPNGHPWHG